MDDPAAKAVQQLVGQLGAARAAAEAVAGRPPLGVRAVEPSAGRRGYVAAFAGPAFLCLDASMAPEADLRRAREAASASLLWEQAEALVDAAALRGLVQAIGRLLAAGDDPGGVLGTLQPVGARALEVAAWRDEPLRALASLPELERGAALHERLVGAWARFVRASEPLVARQDELEPATVDGLRAVEEAAVRAGAAERLADRLAAAMSACEDGADQMVAAHVTRLRDPAAGRR